MTELLYIDTLRGDHATGIAGILKEGGGKFYIHKRALAGHDFINTRKYLQILRDTQQFKYFIGHNRKATFGHAGADDNAHPFHRKQIVLAHNGSLRNSLELMPGHNVRHNISTDSEVLAELLNSQTVDELISRVDGAMALTWWDARDNSMNFLRNDERPLNFVTIKGKNVLIWASEMEQINLVLSHSTLEIEDSYELSEGVHLKIKDNVKEAGWESTNIKLYEPYLPRNHYNKYNNSRQNFLSVEEERIRKNLSLAPHARIQFEFSGFEPSPHGTNRGILTGVPMYNKNIKHCEIVVYNFKPDAYKLKFAFAGELCGIKSIDGQPLQLILRNVVELYHSMDDYVSEFFEAFERSNVIPLPNASNSKADNIYGSKQLEVINGHKVKTSTIKNRSKKYPGPRGRWLGKNCFLRIIGDGCVNCSGNVDIDDSEHLLWTQDDRPYCKKCADKITSGEDIITNDATKH